MNIRLLIIIFSLLLSNFGFGQTKETDSLKIVIQSSSILKDKASAFQRLGWLHITRDPIKAKSYIDSALVIYTKLQDLDNLSQLDYKYGVLNRFQGNYDKAILKFDSFIKYNENIKDTTNIANGLYQKGVVYSLKGHYLKALENQYKTLRIYEDLQESTSIAFTLNTIGNSHRNLKQFDDAEINFLKAVEINIRNEDSLNLADAYSSLGSLYAETSQQDKALKYFKKCLILDSISDNQWGIASDFQNIGNLNYDKKNYNVALDNLNKAFEIQKKNNYKSDMIEVMSKIGAVHLKLNNLILSENYLTEALQLGSGSLKIDSEAHYRLNQLFESKKDFKMALFHSRKSNELKDSIFKLENLKSINNLRLEYETEKKDKEIAQQQLTLEKSQAKTQIMTILIISLLIASILLWSFFRQRQKRIQQQLIAIQKEQEIHTLESLIAGEEKERLRIAKELHDGVNGDLSAIKFKLSSLLKMNNEVINDAVSMIDNSCKQVRAISHNLVPPSLKNFSLIEAVSNYCENMASIHKPEISFQNIGEPIDLNKKVEVNIFRIIQELINNATKHAEATSIDVQISNRDNTILITVEDNGKGYENETDKQLGIGLDNIKSRVEYLNAKFDVITNTSGTYNTIEIDLNKINDN